MTTRPDFLATAGSQLEVATALFRAFRSQKRTECTSPSALHALGGCRRAYPIQTARL